MVDVEVDRRVDEISASNRKLYMCTSSSKLHRSNSGQTKDLSPEPADRVNPKPRHFSIHKSWVIHIIIWYFFLITLISSAKQCYWRDYLRPKDSRPEPRTFTNGGKVLLAIHGRTQKEKIWRGRGYLLFFGGNIAVEQPIARVCARASPERRGRSWVELPRR